MVYILWETLNETRNLIDIFSDIDKALEARTEMEKRNRVGMLATDLSYQIQSREVK